MALTLLSLVGSSGGQTQDGLSHEKLLAPYKTYHFSELYRQAIDAFFTAEEAYRNGEYVRASELLNRFWNQHPSGTKEWGNAVQEAQIIAQTAGANFGTPVCYYALRMLTECASWRVKTARFPDPKSVRLTVVLVGHSNGPLPATWQELRENGGHQVTHTLNPLLLTNRHQIIRESAWLFQEYVRAITDGRLAVEMDIVSLPDLSVPMRVTDKPLLSGELAPGAVLRVWEATGSAVRSRTDWWWVIYPWHAPEQRDDFAQSEFGGGGGMSVGPDGISPAFLSDDLWFVRKPPHLGKGLYGEEERCAYVPQWLQHEFLHHLYRSYPEFHLEASDHQWFNRKTWPQDFQGSLEPDYYAESLHRRLQPLGNPPLHVKLRYAPPSSEMFQKITPAMLIGAYHRDPITNAWHEGRIEAETTSLDGLGTILRWNNRAGASWRLVPDLSAGLLLTDPTNPYYDLNPDTGRAFRIVLRRGTDGDYLPEVAGFAFNSEFYARNPH